MIETSLRIHEVDLPKLTGGELQRMILGVLRYNEIIEDGVWPEHTVFADILTDEETPTTHVFVVRMCESEADEIEIKRLAALIEDTDTGNSPALHFRLDRKP